MRLGLLALGLFVAFTASVSADDDYKPPPITRHWRVRVSINETIETHGKTQYEGMDDVLASNASYSFVVGTTDDDLAGNAYAISQDPSKDLKSVEGTGSYHQKQTFTTTGSSAKKFRMIDGLIDTKNSRTDCLYQKDSWECNVKVVFAGKESWDPNPTGAAPTDYPAGAMASFGGGPGIHQNESWSKAFKLPHDRFTFSTGREVPGMPGSSHSLKASVDIEPLESVGYEAVFVPDAGYDQWLPEGPPVAPSTHQPATLGLHLELRDARTHAPIAKSFRANLILDSSRLVGDCMNYPAAGSSPPDKPDVYFEATKNRSGTVTRDELSLDLVDGKGGAAVQVSSRDWGGYAKLRAHVVVSDGAELDAVIGGSGASAGTAFLAIPKDDDGNHIADAWDKTVRGKHTPEADDELATFWYAGGDGFTAFEEYRGFIDADPSGTIVASKGPTKQHERFDPNKRDIMVGLAVDDKLVKLAADGIAAWARISGVAVHYVADKNLLAKTGEDFDANYPRRADLWGDGHDDLFAKPQMALWVQSITALGNSTHAQPTRAETHFTGEIDESQTDVFGHLRDVKFVVINFPAADGTIDALICDIDPDCKFMKVEHAEWQTALVPLFSKAELRKRAAWARANMPELDRRFTQFVFIHELGHAAGAYHHGKYSDPLHAAHGDKQCPMRYWHIGDNYLEVADFVGNKWDLTTAHNGTPWRWCGENLPQMRISDY